MQHALVFLTSLSHRGHSTGFTLSVCHIIIAIGDDHKELWGYCTYACSREKFTSGNGENSEKEGLNNICLNDLLIPYVSFKRCY